MTRAIKLTTVSATFIAAIVVVTLSSPLFSAARLPGANSPDRIERFLVLVPLDFNDGKPIASEKFDELFAEFIELSGGYTIAGEVRGAYRMADGTKQTDRSLVVWIALRGEKFPELRRIVQRFGREVGQESMYLERTGGAVEFVASRT